MRIVAIVGGIALILIALFFGWVVRYFCSLPMETLNSYSLEWLPVEAPKDIDRFQIDTSEGVIKYFYIDKQTSKLITLTHPFKVDDVYAYKVKNFLIVDYFLVVSLTTNLATRVGIPVFAVLALMLGIIGFVALIGGIRDEV